MFSKIFTASLCLLIVFDRFMKLHLVLAGGGKDFFGGGKENEAIKRSQISKEVSAVVVEAVVAEVGEVVAERLNILIQWEWKLLTN